MTTIVYHSHGSIEGLPVMVSDSQATSNDCYLADRPKIYKINGHLVGFAGTAFLIEPLKEFFEENMKDGQKLPTLPAEFFKGLADHEYITALVVRPDGTIYRYEGKYAPVQLVCEFTAIGSGRDFALGAMEVGASVTQAVAAAQRFDINTGGDIQCLYLKE